MRALTPIFGTPREMLTHGGIERVARAACHAGFAIIYIEPNSKTPICPLPRRDRAKDPHHACGLKHACTDPDQAFKDGKRLGKEYGDGLNLAIVIGASKMIMVDCDTPEQWAAFTGYMAEVTGDLSWLERTPSIRTPGSKKDGEWVHYGAGHFHLDAAHLPEGTLPPYPSSFAIGGAVVKWGEYYALVPPSTRPEGAYTVTGDAPDAPQALVDDIIRRGRELIESRQARAENRSDNPTIAAWSVETEWSEILEPLGWSYYKHDVCGCPIISRPGDDRTTDRSAIAHEAGCSIYPCDEGHGPLHFFTDAPGDPFTRFIEQGQRTVTKLQAYAAIHCDHDIGTAMDDLGLNDDAEVIDWINSFPDAEPQAAETPPEPPRPTKTVRRRGSPPPEPPEAAETAESVSTPPNGKASKRAQPTDPYADILRAARLDPEDQTVRTAVQRSSTRYRVERAGKMVADRMMRSSTPLAGWEMDEDLLDRLSGDIEEERPTLLCRTDGKGLLYEGRANMPVGRRAAGKTWLAIMATKEKLEGGGSVFYLDMEDSLSSFRARCNLLGVDLFSYALKGQFVWKRPGTLDDGNVTAIVEYLGEFDLVIVDVFNRLITRVGGDPDTANVQVTWLFDHLIDPLCQRETTILLLDHPNKKSSKRDITIDEMEPGGGGAKLNSLSGSAFFLKPIKPFSREDPEGIVELWTIKDRNGWYEEGAVAAVLKAHSDYREENEDGTPNENPWVLNFELEVPTGQDTSSATVVAKAAAEELELLNRAKERVLEVLTQHGSITKKTMKDLVSRPQRTVLATAMAELELDGQIEQSTDETDHGKWRKLPGPPPSEEGGGESASPY